MRNFSINLPERVIKQVDKRAKTERRSRSNMLLVLIEQALDD